MNTACHIWMSHVTHMNESCHTYEWVVPHIWMEHVSHMNESCQTYERGLMKMPCPLDSTKMWRMTMDFMKMRDSMWHVWISHVRHMNADLWKCFCARSLLQKSPIQEIVYVWHINADLWKCFCARSLLQKSPIKEIVYVWHINADLWKCHVHWTRRKCDKWRRTYENAFVHRTSCPLHSTKVCRGKGWLRVVGSIKS